MTFETCGLRWTRSVSLRAAASLALLAVSAQAQTASQIVQDTYQPPMQRMTGELVFSGAPGLAPPPGAEELSIQLSGVRVDGALPGSEAEVEALRQRLTGGRIAVSEIFTAASDLETAYVRMGYVLSRVVIPEQTLEDGGALRLTVVNGFVEAVDASAVPEPLRARLGAMTDSLVGRPSLRLPDIERRLLLAGDMFGVALGSALSTGSQPGGTVIILDPQFRSITGFVGIDNTFSEELGPLNVSSGLEFNNHLGLGEVFYVRASGHPDLGSEGYLSDRPQLRTIAGGAVFPVGSDGLTFGIEAADSKTGPDSGAVVSASDFERLSFRLFYPVVRSVKRNISVTAAFDMQSDRQTLDTIVGDFPLYKDRTRVLRLSSEGRWQLSDNSTLRVGATMSLGIDGLGARNASDAVGSEWGLSHAGADADFRKLEFSFRYDRDFRQDWSLSLAGQAQTSFGDPLFSSEQFGIASSEGLSAFDLGSLSGDSGWFLRGEVARNVPWQGFGRPLIVSPYLFTALGAVSLEGPGDDPTRIDASVFGVGVDLKMIRDPNYSSALLRLEYGKGSRDDGETDPERFTIVSSYRF